MRQVIGIILSFLPFLCFSQSIESDIKQIRTWYGDVESNIPECTLMDLEDYSQIDDLEGPSIIQAYYHPETDQFLKIVVEESADWTMEISQYYLKNEKLFFEFTTGNYADEMYIPEEVNMTEQEYWERGGEAKTIKFYQYRTYFKNGEVIRFLSKSITQEANEEAPSFGNIPNETEQNEEALGAPDLESVLKSFRSQL